MEVARGMPSGGDVDAALVGDLGVLTETAAKEGMVSVAVEALYGHLTSSSCHPKIFVKEFSYFLMSCH